MRTQQLQPLEHKDIYPRVTIVVNGKKKVVTFKTGCTLYSCRRAIPLKRQKRNADTCSSDCQKLLRKMKKAERDSKVCDHCGKPVNREEKAEFRFWREETAQRNGLAAKRVRGAANPLKAYADICPDPANKRKRPKPAQLGPAYPRRRLRQKKTK